MVGRGRPLGARARLEGRCWAAPAPFDPLWLDLMGQRGLLAAMRGRGLPRLSRHLGQRGGGWRGWDMHLGEMRNVLDRYNPEAEIWITEAGYSTWRNDEMEQARRFASRAARRRPTGSTGTAGSDLPPDVPRRRGCGSTRATTTWARSPAGNQPKLLARLLTAGGVERVREVTRLPPRAWRAARGPGVTGGAGFIGANLADALLADGRGGRRHRQPQPPGRRGQPRLADGPARDARAFRARRPAAGGRAGRGRGRCLLRSFTSPRRRR
jgi:CDP-paratose 2-epimerase